MRRQQQLVFIVALAYLAASLFSVVNAGQDAARLDALAQFAAAALSPVKGKAAAGAVERLAAELAGPRLAAIKGDELTVDLG